MPGTKRPHSNGNATRARKRSCYRDLPVDASLKSKVQDRVARLLSMSPTVIGMDMPQLDIHFNIRGRASGKMRRSRKGDVVKYTPHFNPIMWQNPTNTDEFLFQTVAHEVAHAMQRYKFGYTVKSHGKEWAHIMERLGAEPRRCHTLSTKGIDVPYICPGCNYQYQLSKIKHGWIQKGQRKYQCAKCDCRLPLQLVVDLTDQ